MKKVLLIALIVGLGVGGYWLGKRPTGEAPKASVVPTPATTASPVVSAKPVVETDEVILAAIRGELAAKYKQPEDNFILTLSSKDTTHAKGMVNLKGEMGGGIWFGAKAANGWKLAFDGNGIVDCASANKYEFSTTMIPNCMDTVNGGAVVER